MAIKYSKKTAKRTSKLKTSTVSSVSPKRPLKSAKNGSKSMAKSSGKKTAVSKPLVKNPKSLKSGKKTVLSKSTSKNAPSKNSVTKKAVYSQSLKKSTIKPLSKRNTKLAPQKPVKARPQEKAPIKRERLEQKKTINTPQKTKPLNGTSERPIVRTNATKPIITEQVRKIHPIHANGNGIDSREKSRYSDEELQEFKDLIVKKLEASRSELKYLQEQISRSSDMGDDSDARFKGLDDGTSTSEREYLSQMASRQIQYIGHLEKALIRIENKTYGICRETGKLISRERLRAVPHATLSIEAKQGKG